MGGAGRTKPAWDGPGRRMEQGDTWKPHLPTPEDCARRHRPGTTRTHLLRRTTTQAPSRAMTLSEVTWEAVTAAFYKVPTPGKAQR